MSGPSDAQLRRDWYGSQCLSERVTESAGVAPLVVAFTLCAVAQYILGRVLQLCTVLLHHMAPNGIEKLKNKTFIFFQAVLRMEGNMNRSPRRLEIGQEQLNIKVYR